MYMEKKIKRPDLAMILTTNIETQKLNLAWKIMKLSNVTESTWVANWTQLCSVDSIMDDKGLDLMGTSKRVSFVVVLMDLRWVHIYRFFPNLDPLVAISINSTLRMSNL